MTPSDAQWAWIAGLFEGEGTIRFCARHAAQVSIGMSDRDVLDRLDALVPSPGGILLKRAGNHRWKDLYLWHLSSKEAIDPFLQGVLPWLGNRRGTRVRATLKRLGKCVPRGQMHTHCRRGHPLVPGNLLVMGGVRRCKTCRIASGHHKGQGYDMKLGSAF